VWGGARGERKRARKGVRERERHTDTHREGEMRRETEKSSVTVWAGD